MLFAPFRGSLFDPARVPDIPLATCPPYDVINPDDERRYRDGAEHNLVRLLLAGPGDPTYQEAARLLANWRREGDLRTDPEHRFYLYRMRYTDETGTERTAAGIIGALALLTLGEQVLPHEETMPKTKADRLAVLSATRANLDLIIALTSSKDFPYFLETPGAPRLSFEIEGVHHSLFDITDPKSIASISAAVASHPVAIADGHHRYTTGLNYRGLQVGSGPWDSIMAFLVPAQGSGLTIGPTHRVFPRVSYDLSRLGDRFTVVPGAPVPPNQPGTIVLVPSPAHSSDPVTLIPRHDRLQALPEPWRQASPAVARELLYPLLDVDESQATYFADPHEALQAGAGYPKGMVAMMATISEHAISEATEAGLRFPQKSTFFVPKPRSGLVIRCFEDG
ncbi:MAG: DUF1015 domain-containing protein [Acidimicrobiia bacterium]|nr:DUF1015 domain-containing protein [Acidimicrobiia bacterium]